MPILKPGDKRMEVIVSDEQHRLFSIAAQVTGRNLSQWVRFNLMQAAEDDIRLSRQHRDNEGAAESPGA